MSLNYEGQTINSMKWNGQEILGGGSGGGNPFELVWCYQAKDLMWKDLLYPNAASGTKSTSNYDLNYTNLALDRFAFIKSNIFESTLGPLYFFYYPDKRNITLNGTGTSSGSYINQKYYRPYVLRDKSGNNITLPINGTITQDKISSADTYGYSNDVNTSTCFPMTMGTTSHWMMIGTNGEIFMYYKASDSQTNNSGPFKLHVVDTNDNYNTSGPHTQTYVPYAWFDENGVLKQVLPNLFSDDATYNVNAAIENWQGLIDQLFV